MRKTKKTLAILAIVAMVFTMIPMQVFAADATTTYERIGGTTQYDTAAAIAKAGWTTADTAVIAVGATGNSYDALSAGPLAADKNAPILLTEGNQLTPVTKTTLQDLGVKNVIIVGGTGVIKQAVEDSIKALGISTSRLAGFDASETSVKVAQAIGSFDTLVLAGGRGEDALSISSIASAKGYPILYTNKATNLPDSVASYVSTLSGVNTSYVIGGIGVIQDAEALQLPGTKVRYGGYDAYDTNLAVIQGFASSLSYDKVYVANGQTKVDALAGAPLAAKTDSAIVLTDNTKIPAAGFVSEKLNADSTVIALGGSAVISDSILHQIAYKGSVEVAPKITEVTSPDNKTLVVTFDKSVVTNAAQPAEVAVKKGADAVELEKSAFSADAKTLTITTKAELAPSTELTISVTPKNRDAITATFTTPTYAPTITVAKGDSSNTLVVTFDKAVDDTKAVFEVKKDDAAVTVSSAAFDTDKKVATLSLGSSITAGTYTVSVTGLSAEAITATYTEPTPEALDVESVSAINLTAIKVEFNREVEEDSAENYNNYTLKLGSTTESLSGDEFELQEDGQTLVIYLDSNLSNQEEYSLTVNGVRTADKAFKVEDKTVKFKTLDVTAPEVAAVEANGLRQVKVTFSEDVTNVTAKANYKLNGKPLSAYGAGSIAYDYKTYTATIPFSLDLPEGANKLAISVDNSIEDYVPLKVVETEKSFDVTKDLANLTISSADVVKVQAGSKEAVAGLTSGAKYVKVSFNKPLSYDGLVIDGSRTNVASSTDATNITLDGTAQNVQIIDGALYLGDGTITGSYPNGTHLVRIDQVNLSNDDDSDDYYLVDTSGVKLASNATITFTVDQDNTKPTVEEVSIDDSTHIFVTFSEDVTETSAESAANIVLRDKDDEAVTISQFDWDYDSLGENVVRLTLAEELQDEAYTLILQDVTDEAGNKLDKVTKTLNPGDVISPKLSGATVNATTRTVYVKFSKSISTESLTNKANYTIGGKELPAAATVEAQQDNQVLKIVVPSSFVADLGGTLVGKDVVVANIIDENGNKMKGLYQTVTTTPVAAITIKPYSGGDEARVKDSRTIELQLSSELSELDPESFVVGTTADPNISVLATSSFTNKNGYSVVTLKLGKDITDATNKTALATGLTVELANGKDTKALDGAKITTADPLNVTDKVAPGVKSVKQDASNANQIVVTFTEDVDFAVNANVDFVVKDLNTNDTLDLTEFNVVANTSNSITLQIEKNGISNHKFSVGLNNGRFITDTAGNEAKTFEDKVVRNDADTADALLSELTAPAITAVTASAGSYNEGDVIDITVDFDEDVVVDLGTGSITLGLDTVGTASYSAAKSAAAGDDKLVFEYTVASGDNVAALTTAGSAITLAGGATLEDANGVAANLTGADSKTLTGVVVDTTAPTAVAAAGSTLVLTFDEDLYIDGVAVSDTADIKGQFTVADGAGGSSPISIDSAIYDASAKTVTFTLTNLEDADTITVNATLTDAAGNAVDSSYDKATYALGTTTWTLD